MESFVVIIDKDLCSKTGRDPEAKLLIEKAKMYGKVCPVSEVMSDKDAKIKELTAKINEMKEFNLSPVELEFVKMLRQKAKAEGKAHEEEISALKGQLRKVVELDESRAKAIRTILG